MDIIVTFLLCLCIVAVQSAKPGCPEAVDIHPCRCSNSPYTYLECDNLDDPEVLRKVFDNSAQYAFKEVHVEYSALSFLPHVIFEKVPVTELHLKNVTLSRLFDQTPSNLEELGVLHIENVKIIRGFMWWMLEHMTNLRIMNVYFNQIKIVGEQFNKFVTKNLRQITFYQTGTKTIKPGAFNDFVHLEKVEFDHCSLTTLSRDIFPNPFNVKYIYLIHNEIETLPDDMFSNMPQLQSLSLKYNNIKVIPATSFKGSNKKLSFFKLDGNPLYCDCRLAWLIQNPPDVLSGTCDLPTKRKGTALEDLDISSFKC